jgi:hypothetical protein
MPRDGPRGRPVVSIPRSLAVALFVTYVGWNLFCLAHGQIPPSLFKVMTGLPCPTTGCTRSLRCLAAGEWLGSLLYNPLAVPFCLLVLISLTCLAWRAVGRHKLLLPAPLCWAWLGTLCAAWVFKLVQPATYW